MRIANVIVPPGVGDIFWVYQKIYHYFDEINFLITIVGNTRLDIQKRSEGLVKFFPKVRNVEFIEYGPQIHDFIHKEYKTLRQVFREVDYREDLPEHVTNYYHFRLQANIWLEAGIRLEDIDQPLKTAFHLPLPTQPIGNLPSEYLLVYVSGDTERHSSNLPYLWSPEVWTRLIVRAYRKLFGSRRSAKIVLTGALFDVVTLDKIADLLAPYGIPVHKVYQPAAPGLFWLLSSARYFIGYQSGLNILAENFKTRQLMIYFPVYREIADTWVSPEGRVDRFNWAYFDTPLDEIILKIPTLATS